MMNKKEITQFAKKIIHSQAGLANQQLMHPKREWLIGVAVALCIFTASIGWSAIKYLTYQNVEDHTVAQSAAPAAVYKETLVAEALAVYAEKAKRLKALRNEDVTVIVNDNSEVTSETTVDREAPGVGVNQNAEQVSTTQATSSNNAVQNTTQNEEDTAPEDDTSSENPDEEIEAETIQPATNI